MLGYKRISLEEREKIYGLLKEGHKQVIIAKALSRDKSTISREIRRCERDPLGYLPDRAHRHAMSFSQRNLQIFRCEKLRMHVVDCLKAGWSPEQISGRLRLEKSDLSVSHETIYQYIYGKEGQEQKLYLYLNRKKSRRTKWHSRKKRKSHVPQERHIDKRPKSVERRKTIGHWEADLVIFRAVKSANVTTLVERKSRFIKLVLNQSKYTEEVISGIMRAMENVPTKHRKTMTFDRGTEFAGFDDLDIEAYFCNPYSPWQKGSNENSNKRLRVYLPKKYDPSALSQDLLDEIANKMNNQPRKCLGFKTPAEVFFNSQYIDVALDP